MLRSLLAVTFAAAAHAQNAYYSQWVQSMQASATSQYQPWCTGSSGRPSSFSPSPYQNQPPPYDQNYSSPYPFPRPPQPDSCSFWMESITQSGVAPYQNDSSYQVFRNVKDYGAKGDGVSDDTAAINLAISVGNRCALGSCNSSTTTPATVYFPHGTYLISSSIIQYYYTNLIGNPNCLPVIRATANFTNAPGTIGLIDANPYVNGALGYIPQNVFFRNTRNFALDLTQISAPTAATGIHWPTAQATSLQNIVFYLNDANGTQHQGVFIESGSGGFMSDLVVYGGLYGFSWGNQQFTTRNLSVSNAVVGINQIWDWSWNYRKVNINNCSVGLNMSSGSPSALSVGSVTFIDSIMTNTPIGIVTGRNGSSLPPAAGSLIIENCQFNNVTAIVEGPQGVLLAGSQGSTTVAGWGSGHAYTPNGPQVFEGHITPNNRPSSLVSDGAFYARSKPQYEQYPVQAFLTARSQGAIGNGETDDTTALQNAINAAVSQGRILFLDAGYYVVTSTIYIPAGSRVVGESYPVILGAGALFENTTNPQPVVQVGKAGEQGTVEMSDVIVSGRGATAGAVFIEYNLASSASSSSSRRSLRGSNKFWQLPQGPPRGFGLQALSGPSLLSDVHVRVGGFAGSDLQLADCPTMSAVATPPASVNSNCIAGFMSIHITPSASNLALSNTWFWIADHDIEDPLLQQLTIYVARGMLVSPGAGTLWLEGTAVEHHTFYEYQLSGAQDVYAGQIQTETAYYQPNPPASIPFTPLSDWNDPAFPASCLTNPPYNFTGANTSYTNPCDGYGLRLTDASSNILIYGAGLYSFFANYNTSCSAMGNGAACQDKIFSVEDGSQISIYNLITIGSQSMANIDGVSVANYSDNVAGFTDGIAVFRTGGSL